MKLLMTGVGGPTPRSFALSLRNHSSYDSFDFIGTDINKFAIGLYQKDLFSKSYLIPPAREEAAYWSAIEEIIDKENIEYAVILPEEEVRVWSKRQAYKELPCPSFIPDFEVTELLMDKARMSKELSKIGLVPPSVEFNRDQLEQNLLTDWFGTPFWVRSSTGTSGLGSLKVSTLEALKSWVLMNPKVQTFLASKFLPGRNLACKLLYHEGNLVRSATAERFGYIMAKVAPSGITGNTSFGRFVNEPETVAVCANAMSHIFKTLNVEAHGFFTVDLKEDEDGRPYITEINVRHNAFTQCFAAAGANLSEDMIRILDKDPAFDMSYQMYEFKKSKVFLRDVDSLPVVIDEDCLLATI